MMTERQQEIIDVSLDIISTQGIQGFTIKNLSHSIGISEAAIYRHFDNKISILLAILDCFKSSGELLFGNLNTSSSSPLKNIEMIFQGHFNAFNDNPSLVSVIFSEEIFRGEPILQQKISEIMDKNSAVIKSLVAEGQAKGEINPNIESKYITLIILGSLRMMVKKWQMGDKTFNHRVEVQNIFHALEQLIGL